MGIQRRTLTAFGLFEIGAAGAFAVDGEMATMEEVDTIVPATADGVFICSLSIPHPQHTLELDSSGASFYSITLHYPHLLLPLPSPLLFHSP